MFIHSILTLVTLATSTAGLDFNASAWIWANDTSSGEVAFRRHFTTPAGKTVAFADTLLAAENFTLFVNGEELGSGANYQFASTFRTPFLTSGFNVFAVTAMSGSTNSTLAAVLAAIQITYSDNTTDIIVSDNNWLTCDIVPEGYQNTSYDDRSWPTAVEKGLYGTAPWGQVVIPTATSPSSTLTNATNWIWTSGVPAWPSPAPLGSRAFRLSWTPPPRQTAISASITASINDEYLFFVNGNLVAGGYGYQLTQQFTIYILPAPKVVFAVNATNDSGPGGIAATMQINTSGAPACAECTSSSFALSDTNWKWSNTVPDGFEAPDFDDSSWSPAVVEAVYSALP
ncbi:Carbohydrate-binding module family 67 protein [Mycena sanguinolenta]|uniref:Carbohydrate-binding module family 67 protein n=1 Tax=Mycena sanguinolenta TaxID=230812 RepID=A0A8H6Z151_9AGAR|nr:Carbohydrate-binding module family 67 protein [Mycena sanguinolenta]